MTMIDEPYPDEDNDNLDNDHSESDSSSSLNAEPDLQEVNDTSNNDDESQSEDIDIEVNDVFDESQETLEETDDIDVESLKPILEGAVLAAGEALSIDRMQALFNKNGVPSKADITDALESIQKDCEGRGFELKQVSSGWRFQVRESYATWVNRLWDEKPQKYSRALLETLALIAYRQPITRGDIEEVRGVAVSSHIIKTLSEREWVKVVGHRDVPGRPALYATTKIFLDYFNLKSLDELPTLGELKDIDGLNQKLDLGSNENELKDDSESKGSQETVDTDDSSLNEELSENISNSLSKELSDREPSNQQSAAEDPYEESLVEVSVSEEKNLNEENLLEEPVENNSLEESSVRESDHIDNSNEIDEQQKNQAEEAPKTHQEDSL